MLDDEPLDEAENLPMEPEIIEPEIMEPEMPEMHIDILVAPEDEVENMYHVEHVRNWEAGEEERRRLNYEFRAAEQNVQDDALRVFEDCMVCQNREADQQITCCAQFLCLPCARNLAIPRVVDDVALPFNLCPFCRSDLYVTMPRVIPA
jgi:hypothetical protein